VSKSVESCSPRKTSKHPPENVKTWLGFTPSLPTLFGYVLYVLIITLPLLLNKRERERERILFISHTNLVSKGGESNTRASITVSLDQMDIGAITDMASSRGIGFSAMVAILLTQGRARVAEMESRHGTAMEHQPDAKSGKGTDTFRSKVGTKRGRNKKSNGAN